MTRPSIKRKNLATAPHTEHLTVLQEFFRYLAVITSGITFFHYDERKLLKLQKKKHSVCERMLNSNRRIIVYLLICIVCCLILSVEIRKIGTIRSQTVETVPQDGVHFPIGKEPFVGVVTYQWAKLLKLDTLDIPGGFKVN